MRKRNRERTHRYIATCNHTELKTWCHHVTHKSEYTYCVLYYTFEKETYYETKCVATYNDTDKNHVPAWEISETSPDVHQKSISDALQN